MQAWVLREQLHDAFLSGYWRAHPDGYKKSFEVEPSVSVAADEEAWAWADQRIKMITSNGGAHF